MGGITYSDLYFEKMTLDAAWTDWKEQKWIRGNHNVVVQVKENRSLGAKIRLVTAMDRARNRWV